MGPLHMVAMKEAGRLEGWVCEGIYGRLARTKMPPVNRPRLESAGVHEGECALYEPCKTPEIEGPAP